MRDQIKAQINAARLPLFALAAVSLCLAACNGGAGGRTAGTAPGLNANGDRMPTMRNVADPNAPFTLRPGPPQLSKRQPLLDVTNVPPCLEEQLSLFETRSQVTGDNHTLRLTLENKGDACRLSGFPSITLLGPTGNVLGGVEIQKVSRDTIEASLTHAGGVQPAAALTEPSPQVLLPARGDAAFQLGWTSGAECEKVNRIAVAAPGNTQSAYIPRQLTLCENRILITAVAPGGSE